MGETMIKQGTNAVIRAGLAVSLLSGLALGSSWTPTSAIAADLGGPFVRTTEGPVQGLVKDGVSEFLGIPFAAPPVGELRWKPPEPRAAWTQTLDATTFANTCPQITELGVFAGPVSVNEDCIYLNVFTTNLGPPRGTSKRPVLV